MALAGVACHSGLSLDLMSGDSYSRMGETPHYHRRYGVFTSEFGMGSGGTTATLPPGKFFSNLPNLKVVLIPRVELGTSPLKGALYQLSHISAKFDTGSSLLSWGDPHTTIGATAFHF